jgi:hypothetical protein
MSLNQDFVSYYSSHSSNTNPGKYETLLRKLPDNIEKLSNIIHGLIIHFNNTEDLYDFKPKLEEIREVNTRYIDQILKIILTKDSSPLHKQREPRKRFFGSCRDFSLMLCSILRSKKIPSRLRCGFGSYLESGRFWDHWACEFWQKKENRWILVDPEIGKEERHVYDVPAGLDNTDLKREQFIVAGLVWGRCMSKKVNPNLFGPHNIGSGLPFIRGNLLLDFAALNKVELLPWDVHPFLNSSIFGKKELTKEENNLIDLLAKLTRQSNNSDFQNIRSLYESEHSLKVGSAVWSYRTKTPVLVRLREIETQA